MDSGWFQILELSPTEKNDASSCKQWAVSGRSLSTATVHYSKDERSHLLA